MTIRLHYESGKSATYSDITDRLRLYTLDLTQDAEEGSVALSSVTIDDPNGDYDIVGWRRMYFVEDTATGSNTVMYNGYTADRAIERGPYVTGAGRVWKVSLADSNAVAQWRVMTQASANRGAETDVARVQWLMTTNEMERITQTIYLSTANPVAMDAVDYRGQRGSDVLDDCAQASGKNYFVHTTETAGVGDVGLSLWYGDAGLAVYSSSISLTNVVADVNADTSGLTFYISDDTSLTRDPARVYSGAYVQYDGGVSYTENLTISNNFTRRDAVVPAENVKTNAKATARGARYLVDMGTEEDRITTSFRVPTAQVNFLREGMRVQFKASHLPGYTAYTWMRVLKRTVKQDSEESYLITVELSSPLSAAAVACGTLGFTQSSGAVFGAVATALPSAPTTCLQVWVQAVRATPANAQPTSPTGFTQAGWSYVIGAGNNGNVEIAYRITQPGDTGNIPDMGGGGDRVHVLMEFGGVGTFADVVSASEQANASSITTSSVTPGAGRPTVLVGAFVKSFAGPAGGNTLPDLAISAPATALFDEVGTLASHDQGPTLIIGYRVISSASGSYSMTATGDSTGFATGTWGYVLAAFTT